LLRSLSLSRPCVHSPAVDVGYGAIFGRRDARRRRGPRGSTAAAQMAEAASAALDLLRKSISVDVHTHGGTTGITSQAPPNDVLASGMRAGSLAVACLADVPDGPILGRNTAGVLAALRMPEPGQL
jgi:membrane dipeptidase